MTKVLCDNFSRRQLLTGVLGVAGVAQFQEQRQKVGYMLNACKRHMLTHFRLCSGLVVNHPSIIPSPNLFAANPLLFLGSDPNIAVLE